MEQRNIFLLLRGCTVFLFELFVVDVDISFLVILYIYLFIVY